MGESAMDGGPAGTVAPVPPANWSLRETPIASMATRATFLALFIILGVVGNTVLVATIAQSNRLKGRVLNLFIISISIVNLVDCLGNMPLILGSTIKEEWDYGQFPCQLNAFGNLLVGLAMILGLMLMTVDRFLGVKNPDKYDKRLTVAKANILIVYSWIQSIVLSFPLLIKSSLVTLFYNQYLCSITQQAPLVYVVFLTVVGYLIPVLLIVGFNIYIVKVGIQEKLKDRRMGSQQNYTDNMLDEPRIWTEINAAKYVGVLVVLWCIFEGPYLLLASIQQYRSSLESADNSAYFNVPWQVELTFTWMKLSYPIYLPIVTFGWKKEVWQKFKNCMLCHKSNLILDASPKSTPEHRKGIANGEAGKRDAGSASMSVPVIFAAEDGLHIQTYEKKQFEDNESDSDEDEDSDPKLDPTHVLTARKCDVYGSQDFLQKDEDTSDYDSNGEIDPFSSSNPISVRTEYEKSKTSLHLEKTLHSRNNSASQEVKGIEKVDEKVSTEEITSMPKEIQQTPPAGKKKKKKKKEVIEADEKEADIDPSANYERASHDSGRGSMEDRSKKRKEKKELRDNKQERGTVQLAQDEQDCECETNVDDPEYREIPEERSKSPVIEQLASETEITQNEQPKVKKKKKRKKAPKEIAIEMSETPNGILPIKNVGAKGRPLPELNPVELERSMISAKPLNMPPKLPAVTVNQSHTRQYSTQMSSPAHQMDQDLSGAKSHQRSLSESHLAESGEAPQRPIPAKRSKSKTNVADADPKPKPRAHKRGNTSDSQTHLLSSSNTSTDLSEIHNYNSLEDNGYDNKLFTPTKAKRKNKSSPDTNGADREYVDSELSAI